MMQGDGFSGYVKLAIIGVAVEKSVYDVTKGEQVEDEQEAKASPLKYMK